MLTDNQKEGLMKIHKLTNLLAENQLDIDLYTNIVKRLMDIMVDFTGPEGLVYSANIERKYLQERGILDENGNVIEGW